MLEFKIDIISELAKHGYTSTKIRDCKLIGQKTYSEMKNNNKVPGIKTIDTLCRLLNKQPGSIIRYVPDNKQE